MGEEGKIRREEYIRTCTRIIFYMYMHVHVYTYKYICTCKCVYTYKYICTCTCIYTIVYTCRIYVHVHVHVHVYTCIDHELHVPYLLISGIVGMTTLHYIRRTEQKHDMEGGPSGGDL